MSLTRTEQERGTEAETSGALSNFTVAFTTHTSGLNIWSLLKPPVSPNFYTEIKKKTNCAIIQLCYTSVISKSHQLGRRLLKTALKPKSIHKAPSWKAHCISEECVMLGHKLTLCAWILAEYFVHGWLTPPRGELKKIVKSNDKTAWGWCYVS